jgi:transcriptional regulator with XRE-family HTH domain
MTLERLGTLVGYGRSMVCEIEKGNRMPSSSKLPRLADALGVDVGELYRGSRV